MKLTIVDGGQGSDANESEIETLFVTAAQQAYLGRQSNAVNPDMPPQLGVAHVIRLLLEKMEESNVDLTSASNEEEITRVASAGMRRRNNSPRS